MKAGTRPSRRRARAAVLVAVGALALGACGRQFAGTGVVEQYSGSDCKTVLVVGDSLASSMAPHLQGRLAATGRCATVVNRAYPGSSSGDWVPVIGPILDEVHPDVVVIELVGNQGTAGPSWADPSWLQVSADAALAITDAALSRGIRTYWAVPPIGAFYCQWGAPHTYWWPAWATWLRDSLPTMRAVGLADWRTPFGGEEYSAEFIFPDGPRTLRDNDCVHMTYAGDEVAADATVYAIQHEWGASTALEVPPPVTPEAVPSVTAPSEPAVPTPPGPTLPTVPTLPEPTLPEP